MTDRDLDRDIDPDLELDLGLLGAEPIADPAPDQAVASRTGGAHRHRHRKATKASSTKRGSRATPAGGRSKSKSKGGRTFAALLVVLVMLGGLGGGIWYGGSKLLSAFGNTPDYPGKGSGAVTVLIMPGDTASDVANTLAKADVVKSPKAFVSVAQNDPRSTTLQPGTYRLRKQMKASAALDLLFDPVSRLLAKVTIPEGLTVAQSLDRIAKATAIPLARLQAAAKDTAKLGLPSYAALPGKAPRLEGFLFPATYELEPGMTAVTVLTLMVEKFNQVAADTGFEARAKAVGLKPYQALILASMVQREGRAVDDNPRIARVIYNRLSRGIPLGIDATILYGLGRTSGPLTQAELDKDTPYNTRKVTGLPPTPIASPGKSVLEATLAPATGNWIYYVLKDKQGHHLFTADYDAFLTQKAKSRAAGLL